MMDVGERLCPAGGARTIGFDRLEAGCVLSLIDFDTAVLGEEEAMARCAGRVGAVEGINPERDEFLN